MEKPSNNTCGCRGACFVLRTDYQIFCPENEADCNNATRNGSENSGLPHFVRRTSEKGYVRTRDDDFMEMVYKETLQCREELRMAREDPRKPAQPAEAATAKA